MQIMYGIAGVLIIACGILNLTGSETMLKAEYRGSALARDWQRKSGLLYVLIGACSIACGLMDLNTQAGLVLTILRVVLMLLWGYVTIRFRREWKAQLQSRKKRKK